MVTTIILDTNGILLPFRENIRFGENISKLFGNHTYLISKCVLEELKMLKELREVSSRIIESALKFACTKCKIVDCKCMQTAADKCIFKLAKGYGHDAIVLTNDLELIKKLKKNNIRILHVRNNRLELWETP